MPVSVSDWLLYFCVCMLPPAVIAYLLGSCNGAILVSRLFFHDDVRTHGSGNAGLTNFYRTYGGPVTVGVIAIDVGKAVLAILIATHFFLGDTAFAKYWAGLFCLLGHVFPCFFRFKGGKGILSGGAIAIMIDWRVALLVWGGFLLLTVLTRYVSLGSIYAAAAFPFGSWFFVSHDPVIVVLSILLGGLIVWMHRGNIRRLLKGEERKLSLHKKKEDTP